MTLKPLPSIAALTAAGCGSRGERNVRAGGGARLHRHGSAVGSGRRLVRAFSLAERRLRRLCIRAHGRTSHGSE